MVNEVVWKKDEREYADGEVAWFENEVVGGVHRIGDPVTPWAVTCKLPGVRPTFTIKYETVEDAREALEKVVHWCKVD